MLDREQVEHGSNSGFFQLGMHELHRIVKRDGGAHELAAYLVLCGTEYF